jgi:hypothetical protein
MDTATVADLDRVMSFNEWCDRANIHPVTGHRLKAAGKGPRITRMTARRIGVRERDHLEWLARRAAGDPLQVVEHDIRELAGLVARGDLDRATVLKRLEKIAFDTGLVARPAA